MSELDDRLRRLAERGDVRGASAVFDEASANPARPSVRSTRVLVLAAVALIAVVAITAGLLVRDDTSSDITSDVPPSVDGVLPFNTDTVLVFDDGTDGMVVVDLDGRRVAHLPLEGNVGSDAPFRFHRTGDDVVFGSVSTSKLDGSPSRRVGTAAYFVPALDDGTVWLIRDDRSLTHVELDGRVLDELPGLDDEDAFPLREVRGGMAYATPDGIVVWDPDTDEASQPLPGATVLGDVHGSFVAWCAEDPCTTLHVTDLEDESDVTVTAPRGDVAIDVADSAFSPDGKHLAVAAGPDLLVVDPATGDVEADVNPALPDAGELAWADDSHRVFFSVPSYGASIGMLGMYDLETEESARVTLPFGGTLGFVALPDTTGYKLFTDDARRFEPCDPGVDACPTATTTTSTTAPSTPPTS
jgi:hypothetical protein